MKVAEARDGDIILRIHQDELGLESPREWDNFGTMVCWHRNYDLGDKHDFADPEEFEEWCKRRKLVILPIYMYEHSGIGISTSNGMYPYNCPWDAGQVGYIYCTYADIRKEIGVKKVTEELLGRAREALRTEVNVYNQYLGGDVYEFGLLKVVKCGECGHEEEEHIDGCCGFYGHNWAENGMREHIAEEYQHLLDKLE